MNDEERAAFTEWLREVMREATNHEVWWIDSTANSVADALLARYEIRQRSAT
ncbi:hypothetical protein [Agrococcus jejuensis]|uniref:hypothetical protein n=1 Tax=Agrococcus jejuensis TaxID=399736 RepID=UPI001642C873|nr:hypothetical protein [Agrococcus jejuensis]